MRPFRPLLVTLLGAVALTSACGGSSGSSSTAAQLASNDVAVVGNIHITKDELDHQITLKTTEAKVDNQKLPAPGTPTFKSQVVDPILQRLVTNAQVQNIADELHVTVSDSEISTALDKAVKAQFKTTADYQAYLKKYGLTEDDIRTQAMLPSLLENKIVNKLKAQYAITDKQAQDYYNSHKSTYKTADTRKVHYILAKDKADAEAARAALVQGADWGSQVKKYSLDYHAGTPSNQLGALTATMGQLETNFQNAVFSGLGTGAISALVPVDATYAGQQLAGKCKPQCFFVIRADSDIVKGSQQTFDQVKSQIETQLGQTVQAQKLQKRIQALLAAQKKVTKYKSGFAPSTPAKPSSTGGPTT
jgi:hypothetical protein